MSVQHEICAHLFRHQRKGQGGVIYHTAQTRQHPQRVSGVWCVCMGVRVPMPAGVDVTRRARACDTHTYEPGKIIRSCGAVVELTISRATANTATQDPHAWSTMMCQKNTPPGYEHATDNFRREREVRLLQRMQSASKPRGHHTQVHTGTHAGRQRMRGVCSVVGY